MQRSTYQRSNNELGLTCGTAPRPETDIEPEIRGVLWTQTPWILASLLETVPVLIAILEADGTIQYHNAAASRLLGYQPGALLGQRITALAHPDDTAQILGLLWHRSERQTKAAWAEFRLRHQDGSWRHFESSTSDPLALPLGHSIALAAHEITRHKTREEAFMRQAFSDSVTGLPGRALFEDRLGKALAALPRREAGLAVGFLDLDDFKRVNDQLGHAAGDELLAMVARRLQASLRPGDTISRYGGDEFTLLLPEMQCREDVLTVTERILTRLRAPLLISGREQSVTASLGMAFCLPGSPEGHSGSLLRCADIALYRAKHTGKARVVLFEPGMDFSGP